MCFWGSAAAALLLCGAARSAEGPVAPPVTALAFSPAGTALLVGSQRGIEERTWPALGKQRRIETSLRHVHDLAFAPSGKLFAAGGGKPAQEGAIELFEWPPGTGVKSLVCHADLVMAVVFSADSRLLATASHDRTVGVIDPAGGKLLRRLEGHSRAVLAAAFLPGGTTLVTAGVDRSVRVWDAETGALLRALENHTDAVLDLAATAALDAESPARVVSVGEDRTLRFWEPDRGRLVRFARLPATPLAVVWNSARRAAIASCSDGKLRAVDFETAAVAVETAALEGLAYSIAVHPESGDCAVGGERGQLLRVALKAATRTSSAAEPRPTEHPPHRDS